MNAIALTTPDDYTPAVQRIIDLQRRRRVLLQHRTRNTNRAGAALRSLMAPQFDSEDREGLRKAAEARIKRIAKGEKENESDAVVSIMLTAAEPLTAAIKPIEKEMKALVNELPAVAWADTVKGFGAISLATIIGEAGDLCGYDNPAKLWKRFGLHVHLGVAPSSVEAKKHWSKDDWIDAGYNSRRRSIVYVIGECLIKQNGDGIYRRAYDQRKAYEADRVETKMHAHRRAQRYMEKMLLRDLWIQWHVDAVPGFDPDPWRDRAAA